MDELLTRLGTSWTGIGVVVVAAAAIYLWVIVASRVLGLRSFAKMSAFDFAMTVAVGSIIAGTATGTAPLASGLVAVGVLFLAQYLVACLRRTGTFEGAIDNSPLLLMYDGHYLDEHLRQARLTRDDIRARLRGAGVRRFEDVVAVVFETTGDVSVVQGDGPFDPELLAGVRCGPVDPRAPDS